jgi:hypothetical protein
MMINENAADQNRSQTGEAPVIPALESASTQPVGSGRASSARGSGHARYAGVVLIAAALFVACSAVMMPFVPDDAFISFRYAENLTDGHGLVFNDNEQPIEGYSNFLWVLVCALVYKLGFDLAAAMPWVGVLFGVINLLVLGELYRRRGLTAAEVFIPLFVFASVGPFVIHSITAMETPLFSLLLLLVMLWLDAIYDAGGSVISHVALAITGAFLALCRPEGIVVFPVVVIAGTFLSKKSDSAAASERSKMPLWIATVVFAILVVGYHVGRASYFGTVIPPSFAARFGGGGLVFHAWVENFRMYFISQGSDHLPSGYFVALLAIAAAVGARMSPSRTGRRKTEQAALIVAGVFALIYFNFVDEMPGMRYHAALLGLLFIPGVFLQSNAARAVAAIKTTMGRVKFASLIIVVMSVCFSWLAYLKMGMTRAETGNQSSAVALAEWLVEAIPGNTILATNESGIIPYYTGFQTIDIAPHPVTSKQPRIGVWEEWFAETRGAAGAGERRGSNGGRPDVIVLTGRGIFYATMEPEHYELVSSPQFNGIYRLLGVVRYDWFEDQSYWVYIPKDRSPFEKELLDRFPLGIGSVKRLYRK